MKKLLISIFGTSGVFVTSISSHTFNYWNQGEKLSNFAKEKINRFSSINEINKNKLIRKVEKTSQPSSLFKNYFLSWRLQSEGSSEDLYLVTKDNLVVKVPASKYGQKRRRMSDGHLIDKYDSWFGYRSFKKIKRNQSSELMSNMEKVKRFFDLFKVSDENEMKQLGEWWEEKLSDEQKCEILDIFVECDFIKKHLSNNDKNAKTIKEVLRIYPERIVSLARREEFKAPKLSDFIGKRKIIYLPEIGEFGYLIGGTVDEWMVDYLNDEYINKENKGEVNGFSLLEKLFKGEHTFKNCSSEENSNFYPECKKEILIHYLGEKTKFGEEFVTPKVVGVVKGGTIEGTSSIRVSTGTQINRTSPVQKWIRETTEESPEQAKEFISAFKSTGRKEGIIDVRCKRFEKALLWIMDDPRIHGCKLAWELIIPGDVIEKRWCLFEIPNGKGYLREYEISIFKFSYLWNNNKFWAKCSNFGL